MSTIIDIPIEQIFPEQAGVLESQGIPPGVSPSPPVKELYESAKELFINIASPVGIISDISLGNFEKIYPGNGRNAPDTPLEKIFPKASALALFAFTLGREISNEIERQFNSNGLAMGYMLDAIASFCVDKASEAAQVLLLNRITSGGRNKSPLKALLYSPGYCGWHISGQSKLFDQLRPEEIGIHLNESFLMVPLKSISGLLAAGEPEIHRFVNNYPFCRLCKSKNCRDRMGS